MKNEPVIRNVMEMVYRHCLASEREADREVARKLERILSSKNSGESMRRLDSSELEGEEDE